MIVLSQGSSVVEGGQVVPSQNVICATTIAHENRLHSHILLFVRVVRVFANPLSPWILCAEMFTWGGGKDVCRRPAVFLDLGPSLTFQRRAVALIS